MPTLRAVAVAALACLAAAGRASAGEPPQPGVVEFLPTYQNSVGAMLAAGPFRASHPDLEKSATAMEGGTLPEGQAWRLALAPSGAAVIAPGKASDRGVFYAQAEFVPAEAGRHLLGVLASGDMVVWLDGKLVISVGNLEAGEHRFDVGAGLAPFTVLVRLVADGRPGAFRLFAGRLPSSPAGLSVDKRAPEDAGPTPLCPRLRLADASAERAARLVEESLVLRATQTLVRRGDRVLVGLGRGGACPVTTGLLAATVSADLTPMLADITVTLEGLGREPLTVSYTVPDALADRPAGGRPAIGVRFAAELVRDGQPFARVSTDAYVVERLRTAAEELGNQAAPRGPRETRPASALAYARLQAEKVALALSRLGGPDDPAVLGRDIEQAARALDEAEAGRDFQAGRTGGFERAYVSKIDDSPQPYLVYVPAGIKDGAGSWPLVVYLHGWVPTYDKDAWLVPDERMNEVMEAEGCLLAIPFGRSNTDFLNVGEDDVLAVIDEMKRAYPVDPARVYLYGYSMGGSGVWTMLTHYPDRFAAAVVLAGRADYYYWHFRHPEEITVGAEGAPGYERRLAAWQRGFEEWKASFPAWKRHLISADNPIELAGNIARMPVRIYHGAEDTTVQKGQSRRMFHRLRELGAPAELLWVKDATHRTVAGYVLWSREPVQFLKKHSLPAEPPEEFAIVAYHPRYAGAWGVCANRFLRWLEPVEMRVRRDGKRIEIRCTNVATVYHDGRLELAEGDFHPAEGGRYGPVVSGGTGRPTLRGFTLQTEPDKLGWYKTRMGRYSGRCGPIKEAFRAPFVVVYGTTGGAERTADLRKKAERFAKEWRDFAKGRPRMYADTELAPEIVAEKNLVLFGEPESNAYIARLADRLPIKFSRERATIAGETYELASGNRGLMFVYPNIDNPRGSLVVIASGLYWGDRLSENHKFDWLPDFMIYEDAVDPLDPDDPVNLALVAGFFGPDWRLETGRVFTPRAPEGRPGVAVPPRRSRLLSREYWWFLAAP